MRDAAKNPYPEIPTSLLISRRLHWSLRVPLDAFLHFNAADGWAIASHIALSTLMSLFPFLIVVTALAGIVGSQSLADEAARLLLDTWPAAVAEPIARFAGWRQLRKAARSRSAYCSPYFSHRAE